MGLSGAALSHHLVEDAAALKGHYSCHGSPSTSHLDRLPSNHTPDKGTHVLSQLADSDSTHSPIM
jgi:hypothetical protein